MKKSVVSKNPFTGGRVSEIHIRDCSVDGVEMRPKKNTKNENNIERIINNFIKNK